MDDAFSQKLADAVKREVEDRSHALSLNLASRLVELAKSETADSAAVRTACDGIGSNEAAVLITIFIPSKIKGADIDDTKKDWWHKHAMAVLGDHFTGATSVGGQHLGLYAFKDEEEVEFPHVVQSYAAVEQLNSTTSQRALKDFMCAMRADLKQHSTMLVIGGRRFFFDSTSVASSHPKMTAVIADKLNDAFQHREKQDLNNLERMLSLIKKSFDKQPKQAAPKKRATARSSRQGRFLGVKRKSAVARPRNTRSKK